MRAHSVRAPRPVVHTFDGRGDLVTVELFFSARQQVIKTALCGAKADEESLCEDAAGVRECLRCKILGAKK